MKSRSLSFLFVISSSISLFQCGGAHDNLPPPPPPAPLVKETPPPPLPPAPAPLPPVSLSEGAASPDVSPTPTVNITAPKNFEVIPLQKASDFVVKLDVKNWQVAEGSQHIHLILDNNPYLAVYNLNNEIKLSDVIGKDMLTEGHHVLIAFPGRANHESVKQKGALAIREFYIGKKGASTFDIKKPSLIFSRPKGTYEGTMANHVLVDFQLHPGTPETTLSENGNQVKIQVTGPGIDGMLSAQVKKFGPPFYLDNLRDGTYSIEMNLIGSDGKTIEGNWNSTKREIMIQHDASSPLKQSM
ncbi:hypothetical protein [Pajaroellobacter abortibovis]|uniref:DUF4397 domain-containing protein n=1 Tax=Pajaroellobacter abortibovis TaxID=1882918 RepID=A0A1L6MX29_9BACT|nr:hypothetical protein [Pajaroellobacter abortibovis]APS00015.1 hypothetical protein BCY86_04435 [Pajaroellobacter abortibovis]